ncbi:uncharacterized protein METZ01_LOCUS336431, partial [marine metagenome]
MTNLFQNRYNLKIYQFTGLILVTGLLFCEKKQEPAYSYIGGWPVNPHSDEIEDTGFDM